VPNNNKRIPSETIVLPPGKALFATLHPDKPDAKYDPTNPTWSIRVEWEGEARKQVEQLLGPYVPRSLETMRERLIEEAREKGDKIKEKKAEAMESELPWREVLNRETAEPTGAIEIVFKRPSMRKDRNSGVLVPNSPPATVNRQAEIVPGLVIPNRSIVQVKMATWPVFFPNDNKAGIKKLLESVQLISLPAARKPDASGFQKYEDDGADEAPADAPQGTAPVGGADY
jgi:hypothetical protein